MNRQLARAVVEFFKDDIHFDHRYFAQYNEQHWRNTKRWLDTSGMALYLLDRLKRFHLEVSIPPRFLAELEQNATDRRLETEHRLAEFTGLVQLFQKEGLRFAVEKGFALVPEFCPDMSLRYQMDFDFLIDTNQVERCHQVLMSVGYRYVSAIVGERRFRKGDVNIPSMETFYKPRPQHTVELHFSERRETCAALKSTTTRALGSLSFPALSRMDFFVFHVMHFLKHMRIGWVRTDSLLEYRRFVKSAETDRDFWSEFRHRCDTDPSLRRAVWIVENISDKLLGGIRVPELQAIADGAPRGVRRWIERYSWRVILSEYPGTKLYLILECESLLTESNWWLCARRLVPRCLPAHVAASDDKPGSQRRAFFAQAQYVLHRCWYHLRELIRMSYAIPAWNWHTWRSTK